MGRTGASREAAASYGKRYLGALRRHVRKRGGDSPDGGAPAARLGRSARDLGIDILGLARVHDDSLELLPAVDRRTAGAEGRARAFFSGAVAPLESRHGPALEALSSCRRLERALGRGADALATARSRLGREGVRRRDAESALVASEARSGVLLGRSTSMKEQLRRLTRKLLTSHEEERRRISRELHDALGQTLTGIHIRLAALRGESSASSRGLKANIARTQRLVQRSLRTVHRFARDLRPALLDDLGLAPALLTFTREFGRRQGIPVRFTVHGDVKAIGHDAGTALFRVAQEALTNVARHARARRVRVSLRRLAGTVLLEVWNDGRSFAADRPPPGRSNLHLGILCMRERAEMVGGSLAITSSPRSGTTVRAEVPIPVSLGR